MAGYSVITYLLQIKVRHNDRDKQSTQQSQPNVTAEQSETSHGALLPDTIVACYLSKYQDEETQLGRLTLVDDNEWVRAAAAELVSALRSAWSHLHP